MIDSSGKVSGTPSLYANPLLYSIVPNAAFEVSSSTILVTGMIYTKFNAQGWMANKAFYLKYENGYFSPHVSYVPYDGLDDQYKGALINSTNEMILFGSINKQLKKDETTISHQA